METAITQAVRWCIDHTILKPFLEENGSEVINMLFSEWNLEEALVVEREEGIERGREKRETEIARNALTKGASVEFISEITGLSTETIQSLANR
jgi:predicted transposase YdaD